jgi:hypothetical protein
MYGLKIERSHFTPRRSVIGEVHTSSAGNVIVPVGRENSGDSAGWSKTEHVTLTPAEAGELGSTLLAAARRMRPKGA